MSTSHFPKAVHSEPTTLEKRDWLITHRREKRRRGKKNPSLCSFVLNRLDASFCFSLHFFLFSFPFPGLNFVLILTSWLVNRVLHFLPLFVLIIIMWLLNVLLYTKCIERTDALSSKCGSWSLGKFKCVCIFLCLSIVVISSKIPYICFPWNSRRSGNSGSACPSGQRTARIEGIHPACAAVSATLYCPSQCWDLELFSTYHHIYALCLFFSYSSLFMILWSLPDCCRHLSLDSLAFPTVMSAETLVGVESRGWSQHWR